MMNDDTLIYRIALASIAGMGVELAQKLLDVIDDERQFFTMSEKDLRHITGSRHKMCERGYRDQRLEAARREMEFIAANHIKVSYFTDEDFPQRLLHNASDAPILVYITGRCDLNAPHVVSVVGTRRSTAYGARFCESLIGELSEKLSNLVVVSGLAYGTDINAHRAALKHGVPTVGVLACGLNKIYPSPHRKDAAAMVKNGGAVLSDYQSQDEIHRGNFLARNRIIAALADCTVVVESADSGGSLVTASLAASYSRDVFAVPGRVIDQYSMGCNKLIKSNRAAALTCADDLIDEMGWQRKRVATQPSPLELFPQLTADEQRLVDLLRQRGESHLNDITAALAVPIHKAMALLVALDTRGIVHTLPGSRYSL